VLATVDGVFLGNPDGSWQLDLDGIEHGVVSGLWQGPDGDLHAITRAGQVYHANSNGQSITVDTLGRELRSLAGDAAGNLYLASDDGVYVRPAGSTGWKATGTLADQNVQAILVAHDGAVFASTFRTGILRSDDHGASWQAFNQGLQVDSNAMPDGALVTAKALAEDSHGNLYAAMGGIFDTPQSSPRNWFGHVYQRGSRADSWAVTVDDNNAGRFTPPFATPGLYYTSLTADRQGNIYAGRADGPHLTGDVGANWHGLGIAGFSYAINADAAGNLYTTLADAGNTGGITVRRDAATGIWSSIDGAGDFSAASMLVASDGTLYLGGDNGRLRVLAKPTASALQGMSISGTAKGDNANLSLSATLVPADADRSSQGQIYVIATLPTGDSYAKTAQGWQALDPRISQPIGTLSGNGTPVLAVLDGTIDVSGLVGTRIVVGYGSSLHDMLLRQRYAVVHTVR
jgi:hypothetical protein